MCPVIALSAATIGELRYTLPSGLPCLPLKLRLDVERLTSPSPINPMCPPRHGPKHGLHTNAPASMSEQESNATYLL